MTRGAQRRGGGPSPTLIAALLIVIGIAVGTTFALTRPPVAQPTPGPTASGEQRSLPPAATGTPEVSSSPTFATPVGSSSVAIDSTLLSVLPASVKGAPLVENTDAEANDLTDPALAGEASALAAALAIDTGTGDFAYVSVVRLRPGVFSEAYFQSWRETFDAGACSQAGGVAGSTAEATIAGNKTFIGHCLGGILTYHVHLAAGDLIVSVSSLGAQRFGQLVVEGLR